MNGKCNTKVRQILEAIDYGALPPTETEKMLFSIIENEINKDDEAADMGLVSVAQNLLHELHNNSNKTDEDHERRINQLRRRIDATIEKHSAQAMRTSRIVKFIVAIAAIFVMVVGIGVPLHWSWFESWSTPDEQQYGIRGCEVTLDMVASALLKQNDTATFIVDDFSHIPDYVGFDLDIPEIVNRTFMGSYASVAFYNDSIEIIVEYTDNVGNGNPRSVTCFLGFYTDMEAAYFMFEQSKNGETVTVNGTDVYLSQNNEWTSASWYGTTSIATIIHVTGDVSTDEAIIIMNAMRGE